MTTRERVIMHLDMDAFFASVEERDDPALRGKPIAVIGSSKRTVVTTASYAARRFGVKTGMNRFEAARLCPKLIFVVGDNSKYAEASGRVMAILEDFSPLVEPFSIDEAFVDLTGCSALFGEAREAASDIKRRVAAELGLTCSVGIAPNKLLAKLASGMEKPDGLTVIGVDDVGRVLENLPVGELCGIGPATADGLKKMGITTCGELARTSPGALKARFGSMGERLVEMGAGIDDSPVSPGSDDAAKSVGHSTTLPKDVSDKREIRGVILKLSDMVATRARRYGLKGARVALTLRYSDFHTFSKQKSLSGATFDVAVISRAACAILSDIRLEKPVRLVGVTLSEFGKCFAQMDLFESDEGRDSLLLAMDSINDRYGDSSVTWAALTGGDEDEGGRVISPSWRPRGVRRVE